MKKMINFVLVSAAMMFGMSLFAEETAVNEEIFALQAAASENETLGESNGVKCFWGCCGYYYTPAVYYYRPVYYYYYTPCYAYTCSYVTFYKSMDAESATNENGFQMKETPREGTPLAAQGIVKGDVITHIDGQRVSDPKAIESITENSVLTVIKAPQSEEFSDAEYGAFEY